MAPIGGMFRRVRQIKHGIILPKTLQQYKRGQHRTPSSSLEQSSPASFKPFLLTLNHTQPQISSLTTSPTHRTMFAPLFTLSALAILAVATPLPGPASAATCSTAPVQCCQSVESAGSATAAGVLASLGVVLEDVNVPIGLSCSPISVVGVGSGGSCSAEAVCCQDNSFGGVLSIGCVPVSL
ncbi:fungal hydrophobin-domain-containing protein [Trametes polyzona]|nr:fungal hydrophobin-domain-containing protein [Trametes polyzona]